MTASHANSHPRSGRGTFGSILVRVIVPLWIVAGASVKLYTFNPALLPEPILDLVRLSAGALGISNLNWWLGTSLRFFIGTEIAAALVMVVNPRLARFLATFILTIFIAVLIATMAKAASRDGISAIWSGSCGCFGSVSPPPIVMFLLDALLLLGVALFRPNPHRAGWRPIATILCVLIGVGLAFGRPKPVVRLEPVTNAPVETTDTTASTSAETGSMLEPFYVTEFADWVDEPFFAQPLASLITERSAAFLTGRSHVVFYRADCEHCHRLLDDFFSGPLDAPVLAIEVPDTDATSGMPIPCDGCTLATLPVGPQYIISTPVLLTMEDGRVLAVCEDSEDHALVMATIQARP